MIGAGHMAHAQKPYFVFRRKGRVHLNRRGRQISRLLAAEVCTSAVVMLDTPCSEVVWRVLTTHSIRQFPIHLPSSASPCAITFQLEPTTGTRGQLKCDGTRTETRFRVSAKRTSPFKSAVASVQSTTGSRGVRISGSNAGYTMIRGGVKGTGYPLHSPISPSLPLPSVTVCHHISTGVCCVAETCSCNLCIVVHWQSVFILLFCITYSWHDYACFVVSSPFMPFRPVFGS